VQEKKRRRFFETLLLLAEGTDLAKETGVLKKVWEKMMEGGAKTKERLDKTAPALLRFLAMNKESVPTIFRWLENRRIPASLRPQEADGGRGLDESAAILALAKICNIPDEIGSEDQPRINRKVKETLLELELQAKIENLSEAEFNSLLDFAQKDVTKDIWLDLRAWYEIHKNDVSSILGEKRDHKPSAWELFKKGFGK